MVVDAVLYGITFVGLVVGSITDLKIREVPDWLSYGLMFSGLGLRLLFSVALLDWSVFVSGVVGFVLFVVMGYLMYYSGQWGGGDSKLLMGIGALVGLDLDFSHFPIIIVFFITALLAGAFYGIFWVIGLALLHASSLRGELWRLGTRAGRVHRMGLLVTVPLFVLALLVPVDAVLRITLLVGALLPLLLFYLWIFVKGVENVALIKHVQPEQLTEGDWIARDVVVDGKRVAGPRDLGIGQAQIKKLIHYRQQGKLNMVIVKEGIPFVPSFLIGFVLTLIFRDWLSLFF